MEPFTSGEWQDREEEEGKDASHMDRDDNRDSGDVESGSWEVTNPRFTTAYAMLADNQMMWMSVWGGHPSVPGHGIPIGKAVP
jgi:hypothetical protein